LYAHTGLLDEASMVIAKLRTITAKILSSEQAMPWGVPNDPEGHSNPGECITSDYP
jgi:hypothetical protein